MNDGDLYEGYCAGFTVFEKEGQESKLLDHKGNPFTLKKKFDVGFKPKGKNVQDS